MKTPTCNYFPLGFGALFFGAALACSIGRAYHPAIGDGTQRAQIGDAARNVRTPDLPDSMGFPVVFAQIPLRPRLEKSGGQANGMLPAEYGAQGRIVRLESGARLRILTTGFESACDPEISFDGKRLLFAGRRSAQESWNVYEMPVEGGEARQITRGMGNCRQPIYLSTLFTLDSPEPWHQISFISDLAGEMNESGPLPSAALYSCRLDGSELRRLSYNLSSSKDPCLLPDGRALFATWQRSSLRRGPDGRVVLSAVNIDGTDYALFSGDQGLRIQHMPCVTTGGLVVFVEADAVGWDGAGTLSLVTIRRNLHSYRQVTRPEDGLFHSPSALPDGRILVSRRSAGVGDSFGLYSLDATTGKRKPLFDDPARHDIQARCVAPRPRPDGRSTVVEDKYQTGRFFCLDVYNSDRRSWIPRGTKLRLRVLEGVPRARSELDSYLRGSEISGMAAAGSTADAIPPLSAKRLLGDVRVETDGSFNVEVPANTPVQLQLLDETGLALETCDWIWVKNRESRGCIGCHEDGELSPENRFARALESPSIPLTLPPERRRTIDFQRGVLPILERKCSAGSCHGTAAPALDSQMVRRGAREFFNRAYESLLAPQAVTKSGAAGWLGKYVHPGRARTSPLAWLLFGRNTARPWDDAVPAGIAAPTAAHASLLTDEEKSIFAEWIDVGAPWKGPPAKPKMPRNISSGGAK